MSQFERNIYSIGKVVTCQNLAEMWMCVCGEGGEGALTRLFKERAERGGIREYWMIYRGPGFLAVVWFGSSHNLPLLPSLKALTATHRKTEIERRLADRRRGWWEAESYDRKKDWSSINHSILSEGKEKDRDRRQWMKVRWNVKEKSYDQYSKSNTRH